MKSIKALFLLVLFFGSSKLFAQNPPIVFHLPFDSSVVDWGTRNFTIQKSNVAFSSDRFGGASRGLWLNNDSAFRSYVDISDSTKLNDTIERTYSLYFKPSTTSIATQMVLLDKGYGNGGWQLILTKTTANSGSIAIRTQTNTYSIAATLTYGIWHHVYVQTRVNAGVVVINAQLNDGSGTPVNAQFPISVNAGDTLRLGGSLSNNSTPFSGNIDHFRCAETQGFDLSHYFFKGDVAVSIPTSTPCRNQTYFLTVDEVIGFYPNGNFQENTVHILDSSRNYRDRMLLDNRPFRFMIPDNLPAGRFKITYAYEDPLFRYYLEADSAFDITLGQPTPNPRIIVTGNTLTVQATGTSYNWQEIDYLVYPTWYSIGVFSSSYTVPSLTMFNTNEFRCIVTTATGCPMVSQTKTHHYVVLPTPIHSDTLINPRTSPRATLGSTVGTTDMQLNITLYPNPANDFVLIESSLPILGYEIYSLEGKLIRKNYSPNPTCKETVETDQLAKGIYLFKVLTQETVNTTQLVID